jgi:bacterioferritin
VSRALFDELLTDEEGHIDFLETQLGLFDTLGVERYALLNAKPASKAE